MIRGYLDMNLAKHSRKVGRDMVIVGYNGGSDLNLNVDLELNINATKPLRVRLVDYSTHNLSKNAQAS